MKVSYAYFPSPTFQQSVKADENGRFTLNIPVTKNNDYVRVRVNKTGYISNKRDVVMAISQDNNLIQVRFLPTIH
ncbi:hypothetical protein [Sporolactobacillus laevolacticus]|uniref:hypothetical protein n=1 Tax=Sporolactobacillus laevolacticus TaxID=33018 RepID=UPI0004015CFF|nr:hypothetical protein [Sporolactobacillus laevolacticus]